MIPKLIHLVWFGEKITPEFLDKWIELNPDYEVKVWYDDDIQNEFTDHPLYKYLLATPNKFSGKSDISRLMILDKFGGIYVDCDQYPYTSIPEEFLSYESFAFYENELIYGLCIANSVVGAIPNSRFINKVIEVILSYDINLFSLTDPKDVANYTGPSLYSYVWLKYGIRSMVALPSSLCTPVHFESNCFSEPRFCAERPNRLKYGYANWTSSLSTIEGSIIRNNIDQIMYDSKFPINQ